MRSIALACLIGALSLTGAADRTFPGVKYRAIGPFVGGRAANVVSVPGDPLTYYVAAAGGGVWKSEDGGLNFKPVFDGQPAAVIGAIAVAPSDKSVLYVGADDGIYRTADGGKRWKHVWNEAGQIAQLAVDPANAEVAFAAVAGHAYGPNKERGVYRTRDGGKTWVRVLFRDADTGATAVVIDAENPRIVRARLQRVSRKPWETVTGKPATLVSRDGGDTWEAAKEEDYLALEQPETRPAAVNPRLPLGEFPRVAADNAVPYRVLGAGVSGDSRSAADWFSVGGDGFAVPDPADPALVYSGGPEGKLFRYDHRTRQARDVSVVTIEDGKYRFAAVAPVLISKHDPKTLYHAGNAVFRSTTGGQTWDKVSGDLTRNDKNKTANGYGAITVLSESSANKKILWAGSDDGLIHLSQDAAYTWKSVTPGLADLPDWARISGIEPSPHDEATAYAAVDARTLDDPKPHLWKTTDFGDTWTRISAGLPAGEAVLVVRADPKKKGLLYAGTSRGVWVSTNDGKAWRPLKLNMPTVAVGDLAVKDDDLIVGTLGRGVYILDDLTPIREWAPAVADKPAHLFTPLPAVRWSQRQNVPGFQESTAGEAAPTGAVLNFHLKTAAKKAIVLDVYDANSKRIATVVGKESAVAGVNRLLWDLRHDGAKPLTANTPGERGPLVAPGMYTVKLIADGRPLTSTLEVRMDPRVTEPRGVSTLKFPPQLIPVPPRAATPEEIARLKKTPWLSRRNALDVVVEEAKEQEQFGLKVRDEIGNAASLMEELGLVRRQIELHQELLGRAPKAKMVLKMERAAGVRINAVEAKLTAGRGIRAKLSGLLVAVTTGDGPPTASQRQLAEELEQAVAEARAEWGRVIADDLPPLNDLARKQNTPMIWVPSGK